MARPSQQFEFRPDELGAVLDHMWRLGDAHRGWVNLQPGIREEDAPTSGPVSTLFSGTLHQVPVCTWVAGRLGRHGAEPDALGVEHAAGPRVIATLGSRGLAPPSGWRVVQDHPRRGIVVRAPVGTAHRDELDWLLAVGAELSRVPLTGEWLASVYEGRRSGRR